MSFFWVGHFEFFFKNIFFCFIPMKISHKLCVRMDGTQFLLLWWFTARNESGNHKWAWVYVIIRCTKYSTHKVQKHWENRARDNSICGLQKVLMKHYYVTCVLTKYTKHQFWKLCCRYLCIYLELYFSSCTLSLVLSTLHSSFSKFQVKAIHC